MYGTKAIFGNSCRNGQHAFVIGRFEVQMSAWRLFILTIFRTSSKRAKSGSFAMSVH